MPTARSLLARLNAGREAARPFSLVGWIGVITVSVIVFWASAPSLIGFYDLPPAIAFALATVQCATIPLAVRFPRSSVALHLATIAYLGVATRLEVDEFWPLSIPALLALTSMLVVVGLRERWTVSIGAWWLSFFTMVILVAAFSQTPGRSKGDWGFDVLASITVTLIALATSVAIGQRHRVRALLAEARRDVELEQALRLGAEERARIARELHDVVAHSMSVVHIRAESAQYRLADLDPAAAREFADIARSARSALREMRQLLGALRPGTGEKALAPQPTIADIGSLIENAGTVGTDASYRSSVDEQFVPPLVQLTVYRIVQEALSNAIRHAPLAAARVEITGDAATITVVVENDPPGSLPPREGRQPELGGQGLRGMRERVALLDGHITQQPLATGGFRVMATIPVPAGDRRDHS
ncbi:MAG TPA: histidine kinase [Lacisediminihabitans sp.]|uniref:sensor histidine kinase n=1 Tax=Lacisediminihabitans sp. TaxID=2787631 RepID=UPI002ED87D5C